MSRADVWEEGGVVWGKPNGNGYSEPAILAHVDGGGTVVLQQEERHLTINRESIPELIKELRRIHKGGEQ